MPDTIIQSGSFTSNGAAKTIQLRESVDWMYVYNYSRWATDDSNVSFKWVRGMPNHAALAEGLSAGVWVPTQLTSNGFSYVDSSIIAATSTAVLTAISATNPPVVSTALAAKVGDIVRFKNLDHMFNIQGTDFTVTAINAGVSLTIGNASLVNATAATDGSVSIISFDPYFYPRRRTITWIRNSSQAVVYLSVTHGYTVGQKVTFNFGAKSKVWGDYQAMNGVTATIVAVNVARTGNEPNNSGTANNIQVDFDASSFAAWNTFGTGANENYPADGKYPITPATVVPVGEDTSTALNNNLNILADATYNTAYIGMILEANSANPELSPAGATGNTMYWIAGKSFALQP